MCGLKEIFEGAGNFFDKKVPVNPTFHLEKIKFNPFRFAQHLLHNGEGFKTLPSNLRFATFPFRDGFRFGKAPMKGELSRSD